LPRRYSQTSVMGRAREGRSCQLNLAMMPIQIRYALNHVNEHCDGVLSRSRLPVDTAASHIALGHMINVDQPRTFMFAPELRNYLQQCRLIGRLMRLYNVHRWSSLVASSVTMSHIPTHVAHPHRSAQVVISLHGLTPVAPPACMVRSWDDLVTEQHRLDTSEVLNKPLSTERYTRISSLGHMDLYNSVRGGY
jgi:hypothetical protein